ncbi:hypothetical protein O6H91_10G017900 [Diphasiastrum complanatum]|uniref:Uncharacterized protein n=1 Tax=Diphasiastrum complanatum TaxID=34168 RepID=A0ACC2CEQ6_DIPCM|nr:hypothetical protein O6H91_10G017900 [Diphasiastrum complanatum]
MCFGIWSISQMLIICTSFYCSCLMKKHIFCSFCLKYIWQLQYVQMLVLYVDMMQLQICLTTCLLQDKHPCLDFCTYFLFHYCSVDFVWKLQWHSLDYLLLTVKIRIIFMSLL